MGPLHATRQRGHSVEGTPILIGDPRGPSLPPTSRLAKVTEHILRAFGVGTCADILEKRHGASSWLGHCRGAGSQRGRPGERGGGVGVLALDMLITSPRAWPPPTQQSPPPTYTHMHAIVQGADRGAV